MILAAEQAHSGVILHILFLHVGRRADGEFYRVPNLVQRMAPTVEYGSDDIQSSLFVVTVTDERDLRSWHDQRNRNEKLVALQSKIGDAEIQREVGGRQVR